jgi:hypothetical protein
MSWDKPFLDYNKQINKIKDEYELLIFNHNFEKTLLESISYYDLINGYKDCFMTNGKFKEGISLLSLFYFKIFDMNFQNILFKYSVYAENSFKTKLAYILSEKYGEDHNDYLNRQNFQVNRRIRREVRKLNETLNNIEQVILYTNDHPTKYYRDCHNHIPAWILFKNVKFNDCINLFRFLKRDMKLKLIRRFFNSNAFSDNDHISLFKNFISVIRKFRNKIAHNSKVITYTVDSRYELHQVNTLRLNPYSLVRSKDINNSVGKNDMYAMILSLTIILDNPLLVEMMMNEIKTLLLISTQNSDINVVKEFLHITRLPEDLIDRINNIDFSSILNSHLQKW